MKMGMEKKPMKIEDIRELCKEATRMRSALTIWSIR